MSGVIITVDTAPVADYLRILSRKMDDMTPVMAAIGEIVANQADEAFENQASPAGVAWKKTSEATLLARAQRVTGGKVYKKNGQMTKKTAGIVSSGMTLIDTGRLRNSLTKDAGQRGVTVGTNVVYAAVHQFGAMRGAFGRTRRNAPIPWGNIPPRPFLPDDSSLDVAAITDVITEYLNK